METTKITKKMYFEALIAMADAGTLDAITDVNADITSDMVKDFAANEIELLDKKASKAKERATTKAAATDALTETVKHCLSTAFRTINEITEDVIAIDAEATTSKVTYRLSKLVEAGVVEKKELVVPATEGAKARKLQAYALADVE